MSSTKTFYWASSQHDGGIGAYQACKTQYHLPGVVIKLSTYGRSHQGYLSFSFTDEQGAECTAGKWASERRTVKAAQDVESFESDGLCIRLRSFGRSHIAKFSVQPVMEELCNRWRTSGRDADKVVDVLTAEGGSCSLMASVADAFR